MLEFTGKQWLLINLATHYGLDKDVFEDRLAWGRKLLPTLMQANTFIEYTLAIQSYIAEADVPEEFSACAIAIWDTIQGNPSNYAIGLDACNSGAQIMSCMGRCIIGMENTGLINTGVRPDLYQKITDNTAGFDAEREIVKKAAVPHLYGSKREPINVFGEEKYDHFVEACVKTMPWVEWIKDTLISSWDSNALAHEFMLPNGGVVHLKVIAKTEYRGKFKDFSYNFYVEENKPKKFGEEGTTSLGANTIHPYDGYVLSELDARCNHNPKQLNYAKNQLNAYLLNGNMGDTECEQLLILQTLTGIFNIASIVAVEHIVEGKLAGITEEYALRIIKLIDVVLAQSEPFELKNIHDEFGSLPNYVNAKKRHYNRIMAETYESTWIMDIIQVLTGVSYHHLLPPVDPAVVDMIMENDYAIC